ncbi:MAG: glycosyl transferase family 1, partial [Solirubrobacterales bacterium]|nr:glycosyl transferase family 1 [Solirubrobacterales bacterium]
KTLRIAMLGTRGIPASYGGVERSVDELSARLAQRGHSVTVYCRNQYCETRQPTYRGVNLKYLPALNTKHLEAISHTALATVDALAHRFDIVHYHGTGPSLLAFLPRLLGRPVVVTVQGLDYERAKWDRVASQVLRAGAWSSAHTANRTIVVSRTLERHFHRQYATSPTYIPNGVELPVDMTRVPPFGLESDGYLLFLGRLVPEKGVRLLIRAYRGLETDVPLVIAGPSSHSDEYVAELNREAAGDARVRFVGAVYGETKDALLANALAFCQPSDLEGLPIALLEAMSHGCVPVVSDLPEHLEVVRGHGTDVGLVFRCGDVASLRAALSVVLAQRELKARDEAAARAIVAKHYSWDDIARDVEAVYLDLVQRCDVRVARAEA